MSFTGVEVAAGVYRLGTHYVNWYLIEERGALTVLDTGLPGYWSQLPAALQRLGRSQSDIKAVAITHHHPDHRGSAARLGAEPEARIFVHPGDAPYLRGDKKLAAPNIVKFLWRPWYLAYLGHLIRNGVASPKTFSELNELSDGDVLDAPGRPRVIHVPGHTPGSCALLLEDRGVLFSGDALVTLDTARGREGPCILTGPVTEDEEQALDSLSSLESIKADVMLPGHGEPWRHGVDEAVRHARARAARG